MIFLSTLSLRRATWYHISKNAAMDFYPRSPCGERQRANGLTHAPPHISIHALLAESDSRAHALSVTGSISIHALLAESDMQCRRPQPRPPFISIHALLAESDLVSMLNSPHSKISIHALLAESDRKPSIQVQHLPKFLSTLSLRRATLRVVDGSKSSIISIHALLAESDRYSFRYSTSCWYFYPRSPCGERRKKKSSIAAIFTISIHALLAESDADIITALFSPVHISIHALLAESDWYSSRIIMLVLGHFYPRSPCGERHYFCGAAV